MLDVLFCTSFEVVTTRRNDKLESSFTLGATNEGFAQADQIMKQKDRMFESTGKLMT